MPRKELPFHLPSKDFLREMRLKSGLNYDTLAHLAGVNRSTAWRMENDPNHLCAGETYCRLLLATGLKTTSAKYAEGVALWQADKLKDPHGNAIKNPYIAKPSIDLQAMIRAEVGRCFDKRLKEEIARQVAAFFRGIGKK